MLVQVIGFAGVSVKEGILAVLLTEAKDDAGVVLRLPA